MKHRVGDTLIEVTLAIGIFSMVAIAVVAVMTSGTSNAQTSLETTLAREEIDTQAEALRFIHSAYVANSDPSNNPYAALWDTITNKAIDPKNDGTDYLNYPPTTCDSATINSNVEKHIFVINTRELSNPSNAYVGYNKNLFTKTTTYPRLIYKGAEASGTDSLITNSTSTELYHAEGIYALAVKDNNTTQIVSDDTPGNDRPKAGSGFYDFYIRTCWYGSGSDTPSTISTVIRLYNPPEAADRYTEPTIRINYYANGGEGSMTPDVIKKSSGITSFVPSSKFTNGILTQLGWNTKPDGTGYGNRRDGGCNTGGNITCSNRNIKYTIPNKLTSFEVLNLYAIWDRYKIEYKTNNASGDSVTNVAASYCDNASSCNLTSNVPKRSDSHSSFNFKGWAETSTATTAKYSAGSKITPTSSTTILYAVWERFKINYNANGGSYAPNPTYCVTKVGCTLSLNSPSRSGYRFKGWSTSSSATSATYQPGGTITPSNLETTLFAVWESNNETITIKLTWVNSPSDLDAHVEGQKSNGTKFHAYYSSKVGSDIDGTIIASLDRDVTSGKGPETFTLNTLGGRNYYYYVHDYSGKGTFSGATVTVTSPSLGTLIYSSDTTTGGGRYWNVFAYKDGRIVVKNTFSDSPNVSY